MHWINMTWEEKEKSFLPDYQPFSWQHVTKIPTALIIWKTFLLINTGSWGHGAYMLCHIVSMPTACMNTSRAWELCCTWKTWRVFIEGLQLNKDKIKKDQRPNDTTHAWPWTQSEHTPDSAHRFKVPVPDNYTERQKTKNKAVLLCLEKTVIRDDDEQTEFILKSSKACFAFEETQHWNIIREQSTAFRE